MNHILYIINILRKFSSESNPLSIKEITDLTNEYYDPARGKFINKATVQRNLDSYIKSDQILNDMPDLENRQNSDMVSDVLSKFGMQSSNHDINDMHANYKIHILNERRHPKSADDRYVDVTEEYANSEDDFHLKQQKGSGRNLSDKEHGNTAKSQKRKKNLKSYYYYESFLPTEEIANLINIIEDHPYYTRDEAITISNYLKSIAPAYFNEDNSILTSDEYEKMRSDDSTLQNNLHDLYPRIREKKEIIIEYSYYDENKALIPRPGYPLQVFPYKILWVNGYCYLIAYNPKRESTVHYRVDRITSIEEVSENQIDEQFKQNLINNALKYIKEHPVMMSGDTSQVSLLCQKNKSIVNRLLDNFGMDIRIRHASSDRLKEIFPNHPEYKPEDWLDVTCNEVNQEGAALWAKEYCTECVIYAPTELARKIKKDLMDAADRYP